MPLETGNSKQAYNTPKALRTSQWRAAVMEAKEDKLLADSEGVLKRWTDSEGVLKRWTDSEGVLKRWTDSEGVLKRWTDSEGVLKRWTDFCKACLTTSSAQTLPYYKRPRAPRGFSCHDGSWRGLASTSRGTPPSPKPSRHPL